MLEEHSTTVLEEHSTTVLEEHSTTLSRVQAHRLLDASRPSATTRPIDVACVGNALMDHLAFADFAIVEALGLAPGGMTLVDIATTVRIGEGLGGSRQVPGGTVTNTAVGIASLGGNPAFVGAVATDDLGERYAADLEAAGVRAVLERFAVDPADPDAGTGRCFVVITPDAERTMATALGAGGRLDRTGIDVGVLGSSQLVYFDGYLLDLPDAEAIVERIVATTRASGTTIAVGLADAGLVERHHTVLAQLVGETVDIVFANEAEIRALTARDSASAALDALQRPGLVVVATCGADGALVGASGEIAEVPAAHVGDVIDLTGAGDLFAAGVCFGLTHEMTVRKSAALGALAAAEVITHLGARPETSLASLAVAHGFL